MAPRQPASHRAERDPGRRPLSARRAAASAPADDETPARGAGIAITALALVLVVGVWLAQLSVDSPPRVAGTAFSTLGSGSGGDGSSSAGSSRSPSPSPSGAASSSAPSSPKASPGGTSTALPARPAQQVGGSAEKPTALRLPDGTDVPVLAVGTTGGQLNVPDDINNAGWWRGGARIGDPFGAMLIAAHVDSLTQGLGPYAQLLSARPGQRVVVSSKGLTQDFVLRSRRVVSRESLPQQQSIFSAEGAPRLVMVTCSGPYLKSAGGYQNLAILTATPSGPVQDRG